MLRGSYKLSKTTLCLSICFLLFSCKKFIEVETPVTNVSESNVYASDATAISAVTNLYARISAAGATTIGFTNISGFVAGLSSDEFTLWTGASNTIQKTYYSNSHSAQSGTSSQVWNDAYRYIYYCNAAIEGLEESNALTPAVKQQLLGEAKFMRALFYFYLTNFYGDVPLILTTDYRVNAIIQRSAQNTVYKQIIEDLKDAKGLLSASFVDATLLKSSSERVRPTKWAATALLARTYLYTQDWVNAESNASEVISNNSLFDTVSLNNVFLKNSKEAIFQMQPVNSGWNTEQARLFTIPQTGPRTANPIYLSSQLLGSFQQGDLRRFERNWIDSVKVGTNTYFYPYKYKATSTASATAPASEYLMILRLGELYLIRAEARAQQDKLTIASDDLNIIRKRAGLPKSTATSKTDLLNAILQERRWELFSEWGHRWFDIKRSGTVDAIMNVIRPIKANGLAWESYLQLFPIPLSEIQKNPNLTQNSGY